MRLFGVSKRLWIAVLSIVILVMAFTFYFRVYIPKQETSFSKKKFTAINRAGKNIIEEYNSYKRISKARGQNIPVKIEKAIKADINLVKIQKEIKEARAGALRELRKRNYENSDSLWYKAIDLHRELKSERNNIRNAFLKRITPPFENYDTVGRHGESHFQRTADSIYFYNTYIEKADNFDYVDQDSVRDGYFSVSVEKFLKPELPTDDFDRFMLLRITQPAKQSVSEKKDTSECCCCTIKTEKKSGPSVEIAYQSFEGEVRIDNLDSLLTKSHGLVVNQERDIVIQQTDYQLYTSRFSVSPEEEWILCGFVSGSKFRDDTRSIEPVDALMLVIILLLTILAMPLLKLAFMSSIERLQIFNVWSTGFSIVSGTALIFIALLGLYLFFDMKDKTDHKLQNLSQAISGNFKNEIADICYQIDLMRGLYHKGEHDDSYGPILKDSLWNKDSFAGKVADRLTTYREFNEVLWLDAKGNNRITAASYYIDPDEKRVSLKNRTYFSDAFKGNGWSFTPGKPGTEFALQSIDSYSSDEEEAGIGRYSTDIPGGGVVAIATKLHSVMQPLLPPGYSFAIVDPGGKVWFHSNSNYNNEQNLLDESESNGDFISALSGRNAIWTTIKYDNTHRRTYLNPIENIPLFIVCFYNNDFFKTPLIQTLILTGLLLSFLFIISGIHLLLLYLATYNVSKLRVRRFFLDWLRPSYDVLTCEKYVRGIAGMAVFSMISMGLFVSTSLNDRATLAFFLIIPVYTMAFAYMLFMATGAPGKRITASTIRKTQLFGGFSLALVIGLNFFLGQYVERLANFIYLQLLLIATGWLALYGINVKVTGLKWVGNMGVERLYSVFMMTWLAVALVIPLFYFFHTSYYHESLIWSRYIQLQSAMTEIQRDEHLKDFLTNVPARDRRNAAQRGNYLTSTGDIRQMQDTTYRFERKPLRIDTLVFKIFPLFDDTLFRQSRAQVFRSATDSLWTWGLSEDQHDLAMEYKRESNAIQYASFVKPFTFFGKSMYSLAFWAVFFIVIRSIGFIIRFSARNIFGLGLIPEVNPSPPLHYSRFSQPEWSNSKTFIVGLPYSGKHELLMQYKNSLGKKKVTVISFKEDLVGYVFKPESDIVIIEDFEIRINDHEANNVKLQILQGLSAKHNTQVLISSCVQPTMVSDYYERMISLTSRPEDHDKNSEYRLALRSWKNVLNDYTIIYQPLNHSGCSLVRLRYVERELVHGKFLLALKGRIGRVTKEKFADEEDFYLAVEEHAETYYASIWNSLSRTEKFVMYDLARDMFVNIKDPKLISVLRQKGVIVLEDSPRIVNESFNNFILSTISEDEELSMDKELRQKGTWSAVQLVIIIALLGIAVFIGLAQQKLLRDFNAVLGAVGAVAAFLLRFGGLFGGDSKMKT